MKKRLGRLISILHRQSQIYFNWVLKDFGITSAEYPILLYLYRDDGANQDKISSYLYIDKSATARAVKSLEQKNYILKLKDTVDKRSNRIYLTDKAKENKDEIRRRIRCWSEFLMEDMDEKTAALMLTKLEEMTNKVERTDIKRALEELQHGSTEPSRC